MADMLMYIVVFKKSDEEDDFTRFAFGSLEAIARKLPDIIIGRLTDVFCAIDDAGMTVDEVVAHLTNRDNITQPLNIGDSISVVCGLEVLYQ